MTGVVKSSTVRSGGTLQSNLADARELLAQDPARALAFVESRLPSFPDRRLFRIAAEACRRLGLESDAEDAELAAIQAAFKTPELDQAAVAGDEGRHVEARAMIEQFLLQEPDDLLALTMAAECDIEAW